MSRDYETIKAWYDKGLWNKARLASAVDKGKLTASEYEGITGEIYPVKETE